MSDPLTLAAYSRKSILTPLLLSAVVVGGCALVRPDLLESINLKEAYPIIASVLLVFFWYMGLRVENNLFRLDIHAVKTIALPLFYNLSMLALMLVFHHSHSLDLEALSQDWQVVVLTICPLPLLYQLIREHIRWCLDTPRIVRFIGWLFLPVAAVVQGLPPLMMVLLPLSLLFLVFLLVMPYGKYIRWFIAPPPILPLGANEGPIT